MQVWAKSSSSKKYLFWHQTFNLSLYQIQLRDFETRKTKVRLWFQSQRVFLLILHLATASLGLRFRDDDIIHHCAGLQRLLTCNTTLVVICLKIICQSFATQNMRTDFHWCLMWWQTVEDILLYGDLNPTGEIINQLADGQKIYWQLFWESNTQLSHFQLLNCEDCLLLFVLCDKVNIFGFWVHNFLTLTIKQSIEIIIAGLIDDKHNY